MSELGGGLYRLSSQRFEDRSPESFDDIERELSSLDPWSQGFFILSRVDTGEFVQLAGSRGRLTVEAKIHSDNKKVLRHYRLGIGVQKGEQTLIRCVVGPIRVRTDQVLKLESALPIFETFFESGRLPGDYKLDLIEELD